jgi:hypothetical protein
VWVWLWAGVVSFNMRCSSLGVVVAGYDGPAVATGGIIKGLSANATF